MRDVYRAVCRKPKTFFVDDRTEEVQIARTLLEPQRLAALDPKKGWTSNSRAVGKGDKVLPAIIRTFINYESGWAELRFAYAPDIIATLKELPGCRWTPEGSCWRAPVDLLPVLEQRGLKLAIVGSHVRPEVALHQNLVDRLRPYQAEGARFLTSQVGGLLAYSMRVGKTPTAVVAGCAMFGAGLAQRIIVVYPNAVAHSWERHWNDWAGLPMWRLQGSEFDEKGWEWFTRQPIGVVGCHYELFKYQGATLKRIADLGKFVVIADELHQVKNRKSGRFAVLNHLATHANVRGRWGLTGTSMRNRPRDLWGVLDFINPGATGGYWKYAVRYCAAYEGEFGWVDTGRSNLEELALRYQAISRTKYRSDPDVAAHLPKSDRQIILCNASPKLLQGLKKLEKANAPALLRALDDGNVSPTSLAVVEAMTKATSKAKLPTAVDRIKHHINRGVKVVVFAHFHETLKALAEKFEDDKVLGENGHPVPTFVAGGWLQDDKRRIEIALWMGHEGPAALLVNTQSSGTGIDLADADVAIFVEPEWVPADFRQAEDRIQDVHQGKRKSPPMYEYLVVKDTLDEAMITAILDKVVSIEAVTGKDPELANMADTFREGGVGNKDQLSLRDNSQETVLAALAKLRARMLGERDKSEDVGANLAAGLSTWTEDDSAEADSEDAA